MCFYGVCVVLSWEQAMGGLWCVFMCVIDLLVVMTVSEVMFLSL
jgi:hypothetical protein